MAHNIFEGLTMLPKLPVDLSTFSILRKSGYLYVDKTEYAYRLITGGRRFFLSRPRRFGKSLFVSTLKEILVGNRSLFDRLFIEKSDYSWKPHGIITLDFSTLDGNSPNLLQKGIITMLSAQLEDYGVEITLDEEVLGDALRNCVKILHKKFGAVAILVDEYDSPILKTLNRSEIAREIRDLIADFFSSIKALDAYIDFVFITGVSSFAKAGIFSGMNNLQNITLSSEYAAICGYTDSEIDQNFKPYIDAWAEKSQSSYENIREYIRDWYDGYHFGLDTPAVYNPFSCAYAFKDLVFKNYWFRSGAPTFLIDELRKKYRFDEYRIINLEDLRITEEALGSFDIGLMPIPALLFQTGYLTISVSESTESLYKLCYPNKEVRGAMQQIMLSLSTHLEFADISSVAALIRGALDAVDIVQLIQQIKKLLTNVPYQIQSKEERFYHALLQVAFDAAGIQVQSEYSTSHGRIDMVLNLKNYLYIIEIKRNVSAESALAQIEKQRYFEPFVNSSKQIMLLGLAFNRSPKKFDITYALKKYEI